MAWKNTTQPFQTIGTPPSTGSICRAIIGSTANIRNELRNSVEAKSGTSVRVAAPGQSVDVVEATGTAPIRGVSSTAATVQPTYRCKARQRRASAAHTAPRRDGIVTAGDQNGAYQPPAMAPTIMNGSAPRTTASGSSSSGV